MNTPLTPLDENKKRAAFKRFSQMSTTGLAVLSLSAFTDVSAKQLPANVENSVVKEQNATSIDMQSDKTSVTDELLYLFDNYPNSYNNYGNNYGNYSENYSNNYSNSCNSTV